MLRFRRTKPSVSPLVSSNFSFNWTSCRCYLHGFSILYHIRLLYHGIWFRLMTQAERVVNFDWIFITSDRQDATFEWMKKNIVSDSMSTLHCSPSTITACVLFA